MPSRQKSRAIQKTRRREKRGRNFLLATLVLVIVVAVGWYVYASAQSANNNVATTSTPTPGVVDATLNTSMGVIQVELYQNAAPKTVTNFVNLARSGFYNNLVWHRIMKSFVIQTGDPKTRNLDNRSAWGSGGSSQSVPLEVDPSLHNTVGYLGMASLGTPNSGTSQFYINVGDNTSLDGRYTVFGKVISGMDVAYAIANVPTYPQDSPYHDQPVNPVYLTSVTISS